MGSAKQQHDLAATILDPPAAAGLLHYAGAMAVVAVAFGGLVVALSRAAPSDVAVQTQDAVMIDLPPVEAGSHPQGDDAPSQAAAPASTGAEAQRPTPPEKVTPPKPPAPEGEKAPPAPAPAAELPQTATPRPPAQAPASAPAAAHETGAPAPAKAASDDADETETRRASAHLITLWQKALMGRLQTARHGLADAHATGVAKIAFTIDHGGRLVSAHVTRSSGSDAVDAAALGLVRRAAPFPRPPTGARETELSFIVPISFKRGN